ncbi:hypothetical protein L873DRAFT_1717089 [Choiromyces venosus 120613-1]|uniref:Uncharacterized protein n=1 Tax=Choiromyces venosus 120613-1 TaxID=1336337 RepID=A0A3N4IXR4_9PEZI|nr:hypothetical protein L873DRAFT_1717089 [Choiromyces venosus 120613-1]
MVFKATSRLMRPLAKLVAEEHPFFIYPTHSRPAPMQLRFLGKRLGRAATMYIPGFIVFFGWPFAAKAYVPLPF